MGCLASKEEKVTKAKTKNDTGFKSPKWRAEGQWDDKELRVRPRKFQCNLVLIILTSDNICGKWLVGWHRLGVLCVDGGVVCLTLSFGLH